MCWTKKKRFFNHDFRRLELASHTLSAIKANNPPGSLLVIYFS
jgi:hypothetical protein